MNAEELMPYIEPIYRFCRKRLQSRYDAEDLAGDILCCLLEGSSASAIDSLNAYVWRVARNRYARWIDGRRRSVVLLSEDLPSAVCRDRRSDADAQAFERVFRCLHTLSAAYRDIFVDHYVGGLSVRALADKYALPESTIKWRLHTGREKIKKRVGEQSMDKIYNRIQWNTVTCNGSLDTDRYLHTQLARAICLAAYEKPLTVEEISVQTGVPALYIEDELPRLLHGEAVVKLGEKYATNFILFRLKDAQIVKMAAEPLLQTVVGRVEALLRDGAARTAGLDFYGSGFGMERLGHILLPYLLRRTIGDLKSRRLGLENGAFPMRRDGGCGWFVVEETEDASEKSAPFNSGRNAVEGDGLWLYLYWVAKYYDQDVYAGMKRLAACGLPRGGDGRIGRGELADEEAAALLQCGLLIRDADGYRLNFPCFTAAQFADWVSRFSLEDDALADTLCAWILSVRESFARFTPVRLESQINQWVSYYLFRLVGQVIDECVSRGVLCKPTVDGVFCVRGGTVDA